MVFLCLALTPSLIPRDALFLGLTGGALAAIGYLVGTTVSWLVRMLTEWTPGARVRRAAWWVLTVGGGLLLAGTAVASVPWQRELYRLMGVEPPPVVGIAGGLLLAVVVFALLVNVARVPIAGARALARLLDRWVPRRVAATVGVLLAGLLFVGFLDGVVVDGALRVADGSFREINQETEPETEPPTVATRSGGPGSVVSWASLGKQGRSFAAGGPDAAELRAFNGGAEPAVPVRVYVGVESAPTVEERAELLLAELERTGAFEREVLCLLGTTGSGWINNNAVDSLEYMHNGDTAMASMQYSYLPSGLSFFVDGERAQETGRVLVDRVHARWAELPEEDRPQLLVFGESLGAFSMQSAFSGEADLRNRIDGALFVGTPGSSELWRRFTDNREPGSREQLPVYEQGETVRFAADPGTDLNSPGLNSPGLNSPGTGDGGSGPEGASAWEGARVAYLQYGSDPITWWSPELLLREPDWLDEPRAGDVSPALRWYPFVTFLQLAGDMPLSTSVPEGRGHNYGSEQAAAWAEVAPPEGWMPERTAELQTLLREQQEEEKSGPSW